MLGMFTKIFAVAALDCCILQHFILGEANFCHSAKLMSAYLNAVAILALGGSAVCVSCLIFRMSSELYGNYVQFILRSKIDLVNAY